ncbi:hypothetical protein [Halogranum rubrum]|uniref:hypothetical protein n=1 Tax=Halogranum rubrum TaxID=553466 RepID=UPI000678092F|nr:MULTISPECIES: hypothetical protein [Halogranum]
MQLTHHIGQPADEEVDAETTGGRRLGRYLLAGGAVLTAAAVVRRRRRRRRDDREMVTIEIRDEPAMLGR